MTCVIICGGAAADYSHMKKYLQSADMVITADSGARHCRELQIVPDYLIGDFDSVSDTDYKAMADSGVQIVSYPAEKDMTDSEIAVELACEKGCDSVILLAAIGSRLDHSLSNISILKKLHDMGIEGLIADEHNEIRLISSSISLKREEGVFITLLPLAGCVKGVTTEGLYYPLSDATLEVGSSRGVSNRFSADIAVVTVREGYLLIFLSRD